MSNFDALDVVAVIVDVGLMLENSAVFQAQVVDQLLALRSMGYEVGVIAVSRDPVAFDRAVGKRFREQRIHVNLVKDRGFVRNLFKTASVLRKLRRRKNIGTAYVRGMWGPLAIAFANPWRLLPYIYDVRGAVVDECHARGLSRLKVFVYGKIEAWGIRRACRVTAVTKALADVVAKAHELSEVAVIPSCIDFAKFHIPAEYVQRRRAELGYGPNDIVFVYSGGLSQYQQIPSMLTLWRRLLDEPDVYFLLLTNDDPRRVAAVSNDLSSFGNRLRHATLPRVEVPVMLAVADIGFMLRDSRELNRAASPVKFAEYTAAGLAVIASPGTGDASIRVETHSLGALVNPADLDGGELAVRKALTLVRADREGVRQRASQLAASAYDWCAHKHTFEYLYGLPADTGTMVRQISEID